MADLPTSGHPTYARCAFILDSIVRPWLMRLASTWEEAAGIARGIIFFDFLFLVLLTFK